MDTRASALATVLLFCLSLFHGCLYAEGQSLGGPTRWVSCQLRVVSWQLQPIGVAGQLWERILDEKQRGIICCNFVFFFGECFTLGNAPLVSVGGV